MQGNRFGFFTLYHFLYICTVLTKAWTLGSVTAFRTNLRKAASVHDLLSSDWLMNMNTLKKLRNHDTCPNVFFLANEKKGGQYLRTCFDEQIR